MFIDDAISQNKLRVSVWFRTLKWEYLLSEAVGVVDNQYLWTDGDYHS